MRIEAYLPWSEETDVLEDLQDEINKKGLNIKINDFNLATRVCKHDFLWKIGLNK